MSVQMRYIYKPLFNEFDAKNAKGVICDDDYIYLIKKEVRFKNLTFVDVLLIPLIQKNWTLFRNYYFAKNRK